MEHGHGFAQFKELIVFLILAGFIVPLFHRLRLSPVIGFLLGGVALGPHGLPSFARDLPWLSAFTIGDVAEIAPLAELGVVVLLFTIGLELTFERLARMRTLVFGLGTAQLVLCALAIGAGALALGVALSSAVVIGLALAISSTAIVLPVMAERGRLGSHAGRVTFAILILQDLAVAPILVAIGALAGQGAEGGGFLGAFLSGLAAIVIILVGGRILLRPLMRLVARSGSQELFLAACLLAALGAGLVASRAGQSMALGAFLAGLLLAETEYRHQIEVTIAPFKGLLLGLFFITAGAQLDLKLLAAQPLAVLGFAAALIVVKAMVIVALLKAFRAAPGAKPEVALALAPSGEFAFVILATGIAAGVIGPDYGALALITVVLSMFAVPALHGLGQRLSVRRARSQIAFAPEDAPAQGQPPVIIVGFGRVGQLVAAMLERHKVPFVAIEVDPDVVARQRQKQRPVYFGEATAPDMLARLGIAEARGLVVTAGDAGTADRVVQAARAARPDLVIIARSRDPDHAMRLYGLGASDVVTETMEASLQLAEAVLVDIGVPMGLVIASIHEKRDEFRAELQKGGIAVPPRRAGRRQPLSRDRVEPREVDGA